MIVVASVSGGKDSTAMCLHLQELGIEYRAVHMDTGWEHPDTDDYIRDVLDPRIGPIDWVTPPLGMEDLIRKRAMFPLRTARWCTQYLKTAPFLQWLSVEYPHDVVTDAVGIRRAESQARSMMAEHETTSWAEIWRPLINWTEQQVIDIHTRHGLIPNPLYLRGANRVGCWPCIFARKAEIAMLARTDPGRIDLIRELEHEVGEIVLARYAEKAEEYPYPQTPTFFSPKKASMPIDEVVRWATSNHQGELFEDDNVGCMRWGLCE